MTEVARATVLPWVAGLRDALTITRDRPEGQPLMVRGYNVAQHSTIYVNWIGDTRGLYVKDYRLFVFLPPKCLCAPSPGARPPAHGSCS